MEYLANCPSMSWAYSYWYYFTAFHQYMNCFLLLNLKSCLPKCIWPTCKCNCFSLQFYIRFCQNLRQWDLQHVCADCILDRLIMLVHCSTLLLHYHVISSSLSFNFQLELGKLIGICFVICIIDLIVCQVKKYSLYKNKTHLIPLTIWINSELKCHNLFIRNYTLLTGKITVKVHYITLYYRRTHTNAILMRVWVVVEQSPSIWEVPGLKWG